MSLQLSMLNIHAEVCSIHFFSSTTDHMVVCVSLAAAATAEQSQGLMCLRLDSLRAGTDWRERMGVGF